MALVLGPIIGKLGGAPAGYGGIMTGTVDMPREWATIPWPEAINLDTNGQFVGGGEYQIRAAFIKANTTSTYNVAARILVNGIVVHTTAATNPVILNHTLTIPNGATIEIQAFTDSGTAAWRALHPGSHVAIIPT